MTRDTLPMALVLVAALAMVVTPIPVGAAHSAIDEPNNADEAVALAVEAFETAFGSRYDCAFDPQISFEVLVGRKGEYRPTEGIIAINPERPVETMPVTVVHELGHQFMMSCEFHTDSEFAERFYEAQGISVARSWFDYSDGWSSAPAEHFAEAIAWHTLGETDGRIQVTKATRDLIADLAGQAQSSKAMLDVEISRSSKHAPPDVRGAELMEPTSFPFRSHSDAKRTKWLRMSGFGTLEASRTESLA